MLAVFSTADASVIVGLIALGGIIFNAVWSKIAANRAKQAVEQASETTRQVQTTNILARETAQQVQTPNDESLGDMVKMTSDLGLRTAGKVDELKGTVGDLSGHVLNLTGKLGKVEESMTEHIKRQEPLEERFLEQNPDLRPKGEG